MRRFPQSSPVHCFHLEQAAGYEYAMAKNNIVQNGKNKHADGEESLFLHRVKLSMVVLLYFYFFLAGCSCSVIICLVLNSYVFGDSNEECVLERELSQELEIIGTF